MGSCERGSPLRSLKNSRFVAAQELLRSAMLKRILGSCAVAASGMVVISLHIGAVQPGPPRRLLAADDSTHRLAIVAGHGTLEWEFKVDAIHDASVLANGNILLQQGWQKVIEVSPEKRIVWEYDS